MWTLGQTTFLKKFYKRIYLKKEYDIEWMHKLCFYNEIEKRNVFSYNTPNYKITLAFEQPREKFLWFCV